MKKCIFIIGLGVGIIIFFASCHKKDTAPTTPDTVLDYYPLKEGNYWIYKPSWSDTAGNVIPQTWENDSVVVKGDTVINGKIYHSVIEYNFLGSANPSINYYRDSANCIVNEHGEIIFSINSGIVYKKIITPDTLAYVNYSFVNDITSITVPLGTYSCFDFKGEIFRKTDNYNKAYLTHNYSCKSIGPVKKIKRFVTSLQQINLDLLNYHIQ